MTDAAVELGPISDEQKQRKALKSAEINARRDRRLLQGIQMTLSGGKRGGRIPRRNNTSPESEANVESAEDLVEKFNAMCLDKASSANDISKDLDAFQNVYF